MPTGRTTTHRKITPMEEMTDKHWLEMMTMVCVVVGEFAVQVSQAVDYTPETLQEAQQAVLEAEQGGAHADNGSRVVEALLARKVTARSPEAFEMLGVMMDITEWHYSYLTRHLTPTEDFINSYGLAKAIIQATASA